MIKVKEVNRIEDIDFYLTEDKNYEIEVYDIQNNIAIYEAYTKYNSFELKIISDASEYYRVEDLKTLLNKNKIEFISFVIRKDNDVIEAFEYKNL